MNAKEQIQGNLKNAEVEANESVPLVAETYTFDVLDLEMIGYVHDEVQKQLGSKTTEAMSSSNFYELLQEQAVATQHREPSYWADLIIAHYLENHEAVELDIDIDLVTQAIEIWQHEDDSKFRKFKWTTDAIFNEAIQGAAEKFHSMTEDYQKTIQIGLKHGIPLHMIAKATDTTEKEIHLIANALGYDVF